MSESTARKQRLDILVIAVLVHLAAFTVVIPFVPDDSYISFRYAEHLAAGEGLRYNAADDPVEAYSNFLWILVCSALAAMGLPLPLAAPFLGGLLGVFCIALLWYFYSHRDMPPLQTLLALLLAATAGPFVIYAISGLETPFYAFLLLLMLLAYDRTRSHQGFPNAIGLGFVGFLVALCRPEGVLALPAILAFALTLQWRRKNGDRAIAPWLIALGVFAVLYAAYTLWRVSYFGEFLPTPFLSKGAGGDLAGKWLKNLRHYFVTEGYEYPPYGYYYAALVVLALLGLRRIREKGSVEHAALLLGLVYIAVYFNFVDWMPGMRYHAGLIPLLFLPIAHVGGHLFASEHNAAWRRRYALAGAAIVLASLSVLMQLRLNAARHQRGMELCLQSLAEWINEYTPPDWKIAMSDVGALPYYTGRHCIDINPRSLTNPNIARRGWDEEYFYAANPEIVLFVSRGIFTPKFFPEHYAIAESPRFAAQYRYLGTVRYDYVEDRCYWMFVPKEWPLLTEAAVDAFPTGVGSVQKVDR